MGDAAFLFDCVGGVLVVMLAVTDRDVQFPIRQALKKLGGWL